MTEKELYNAARYERHMRKLYPEKYRDKTYDAESGRWETAVASSFSLSKNPSGAVKKDRKNKARKRDRKIVLACLDRDSYKCVECGGDDDVCVHHIVPLHKGGADDLGNVEVLCAKCHIQKHLSEPVSKPMIKRYRQRFQEKIVLTGRFPA